MLINKSNWITVIISFSLFFILYDAFADDNNVVEMKNPIFTTKGIDGNPYEIKAEKGFQNKDFLDLLVIEAKLKTDKGVWIYLNADSGTFNQLSGKIELQSNIEVYTELEEKIYADLAKVNTNDKMITLIDNVKYQDSNIIITADKSLISGEFSNITYLGNVKSKILKENKNE